MNEKHMKKTLSKEERDRQLANLSTLADENINTSDIPSLTQEQLKRAVRHGLYKPTKKSVSFRLDADLLEWLKSRGPGYQTKVNALLRQEMLREWRQEIGPHSGIQASIHAPVVANAGAFDEESTNTRIWDTSRQVNTPGRSRTPGRAARKVA